MTPDYKANDPRGWCGDPKRGAALGRHSIKPAHQAWQGKLHIRRVSLNSGGYDSNGTYFGLGPPLYWIADDGGEVDFMTRARDHADARRQAAIECPNARFYR